MSISAEAIEHLLLSVVAVIGFAFVVVLGALSVVSWLLLPQLEIHLEVIHS
jgi:hypothetical protein